MRDNNHKYVNFFWLLDFGSLHETIFKPSRLNANAEMHLFKAGVEPKWEDPECADGGKWTHVVATDRKNAMDKAWLETVYNLLTFFLFLLVRVCFSLSFGFN